MLDRVFRKHFSVSAKLCSLLLYVHVAVTQFYCLTCAAKIIDHSVLIAKRQSYISPSSTHKFACLLDFQMEHKFESVFVSSCCYPREMRCSRRTKS